MALRREKKQACDKVVVCTEPTLESTEEKGGWLVWVSDVCLSMLACSRWFLALLEAQIWLKPSSSLHNVCERRSVGNGPKMVMQWDLLLLLLILLGLLSVCVSVCVCVFAAIHTTRKSQSTQLHTTKRRRPRCTRERGSKQARKKQACNIPL